MKAWGISALVMMLAVGARADSVWSGGVANQGNNGSLVSDQRALQVGDLVTVQILENAQAQSNAQTDTQKNANVSGAAGLGSWGPNSFPIQGYGAGAQENSSGGGSSSRSGKLTATISARVVSVLANGNLYIEGRRTVQVNEEQENILLKGIIRPRDVGPSNTVPSSAISDAQIRYEGHGPLSEKAKVGVFTRILDWLGLI